MVSNVIDLGAEAAKREVRFPEGIVVKLGGETFTLPAELPAIALDPIFEINVDLAAVLTQAVKLATGSDKDAAATGADAIGTILLNSPNLPKDVWVALRASLAILFGEEQWARFEKLNPSLPTYIALIKNAVKMYGSTLGEAFGSASSSETGGLTSSETSASTTKSTRAVSGKTPARKVSSESAGS